MRPFPLPADLPESMRDSGVYLARAGAAHLRSFLTGRTPISAAKAMYGEADLVTAEILRTKAATTAATTQQAGWAKELARTATL